MSTATITPARDAAPAPAPQHLQALGRANEVRLARASLKRRVAQGDVTAGEVILGNPWEAESMTVADLLTSQRRWGLTRTRRFLSGLNIVETKKLGTLTDRQRREVALALARHDGPVRVTRDSGDSLLPPLAGGHG